MKIGVIGGGKVGRCLASYLKERLVGITANSPEHSRQLAENFATEPCTNEELVERAEVLLLTVPAIRFRYCCLPVWELFLLLLVTLPVIAEI